MRLTNFMRNAFVTAAMQDVPSVDYNEQARKIAKDDIAAQLPPKLHAVYNDPALRDHLKTEYVCLPGMLDNCYLACGSYRLTPAAVKRLEAIAEQHMVQVDRLANLRAKIKGVAMSCTTREALAAALPEFEKYLPAVEAPTRDVPVLANVVADFVLAGWPKGGKRKNTKGAKA